MEQGFVCAFVTLTMRPNRRLGQQGGNPPRAAPSLTFYGKKTCAVMNNRAGIVANCRKQGTLRDEPLALNDDPPDGDR
jgi:hypothetical protein